MKNQFHKFLFKIITEFIIAILLFFLGAFTYQLTHIHYEWIILSIFFYSVAVIATNKFVKDTLDYIYKK